jgi:Zn-dependent protease with chaperone function
MSASPLESLRKPRLNPFAFASDTSLRFILLLVFVIAADIRRWLALAATDFDFSHQLSECLDGAPMVRWALMDGTKLLECVRPFLSYGISAIGIGLLLLAAVTGAIYWCYPIWEVRRLRLTPLDPAEAPELYATLRQLCHVAGLRRPPEFLWNPLNGSHLALAFGRAGAYRVGFTGALAVLHNTAPGAFRAVMLHELAHIRNRDIEKAYMALALWWGFLLAAVLPYLVVLASLKMDIVDIVSLTLEMTIVTGIVLLTRNAVLRARELYADARSLAWARDEPAFARVLTGLLPIKGIRRLLSPHPHPGRRRRLLDNTDEMFRLGSWDAFAAGAALSLIVMTFIMAIGAVLTYPEFTSPEITSVSFNVLVLVLLSAIAIVVSMVAGVASIVTWRASFLALMRGVKPGGMVRIAGALAAGVVFGGPVLFGTMVLQASMGGIDREYVEQITTSSSAALAGALGLIVLLTTILAGALVFFLKWVEAGATCWLSAALYKPSPRAPFIIGIFVSCALALAWFSIGPVFIGVLYWQHEAGGFSAFSAFWHGLVTSALFPINVIVWISVIAIWAFPFGAGLWRCRGGTRALAEWPYMDSVPSALPPVAPPLHLLRVLLIGTSAALAAGVALPWLRLPVPLGALREIGWHETAGVTAFMSMTLTSMAVQGVVAATAALAVARFQILHAMFAAFVAGWVLTAAEVLQLLARSQKAPMSTVFGLVLEPVIFGGAFFALVSAVTMSALRWPINAILTRLARRRDCMISENRDYQVRVPLLSPFLSRR